MLYLFNPRCASDLQRAFFVTKVEANMMTKPTAAHTDFVRAHTLAQASLDEEIIIEEGLRGPSITCLGHTIAELTETGLLWLKCPADQKVLLLDISPDIYFETDALIGKEGILIRMDTITDQEMKLRLADALATIRGALSQS